MKLCYIFNTKNSNFVLQIFLQWKPTQHRSEGSASLWASGSKNLAEISAVCCFLKTQLWLPHVEKIRFEKITPTRHPGLSKEAAPNWNLVRALVLIFIGSMFADANTRKFRFGPLPEISKLFKILPIISELFSFSRQVVDCRICS